MVKLLYRLIYIVPIVLLGEGLIMNYLFESPVTVGECFLIVLFAAFIPILSRLGTQMKIIVTGGVLVVTAAVFFVAFRLDKSADHAGIYRELIIILAAVGLSAAGFLVAGVRALKILAAISFAAFLAVSMVLYYTVSGAEVWCALAFILPLVAEEVQRHFRRGESYNREKYVTFLWPFIFVLSLSVAAIKAPSHPYDWNFFIRLYERGREITIELREKLFYSRAEDYNDSMIGFSGDARIGGSVGGRAEEIMSISTARRANGTIYLTGKTFSDFDGREWTSCAPFSDRERVLDSLTAICSAQMYGQQNSSDYVKLEYMDIKFLPFSSKYIFATPKYVSISIGGQDYNPVATDGAIFFDRTQIVNASYRVLSASLNYNPLAIETMTSGEKVPDEIDWNKTLLSYGSIQDEGLSLEQKKAYENYVKTHYTGGVTVSDEVAESLEKIKKAGNTDYERLKILESTLNSMTYTATPGRMPEKVKDCESFLDYFLTESQEGYCVHYATAFCLMARAMGYPSRYAQGYMVTVTQNDDTRVDSSMAHAWSEVWLDGAGWVMFEPTPGSRVASGSWKISSERVEEGAALSLHEERNEAYDRVGEEEYFEAVKEKEEKTKVEWYLFVIPFAALLLFAVLFLAADSLLAGRRLRKASPDEKAFIISRRNLKMLSFLGYRRGAGETLSEFMRRITDEELTDSLSFIPCFERVLYSGKAIDKDSLTTIQISEGKIARILKNRKKLLYLFYRFRSIHGN